MNKFYVYAYLDIRKPGIFQYKTFDVKYEPFYIGKGSGDRCQVHLREANMKCQYNPFLNNKINKIRSETGTDPLVVKLWENLEEQDAFAREIDTITIVGRKGYGPLTNIYEGGEGSSKSEETKRKISDTKKAMYRNGYKHPMLGKTHSLATKKQMSKVRKGKKYTTEQKKALSKIRCQQKPDNTLKWKVIDPNGNEQIVFGLGQFCRENHLQQGHMHSVANGTRKHHKGWKCEYN